MITNYRFSCKAIASCGIYVVADAGDLIRAMLYGIWRSRTSLERVLLEDSIRNSIIIIIGICIIAFFYQFILILLFCVFSSSLILMVILSWTNLLQLQQIDYIFFIVAKSKCIHKNLQESSISR